MAGRGGAAPYRAGRTFEQKIVRLLEQDGWLCIRSAKSAGAIDVAAFRSNERLFIQAKRNGTISPRESNTLYQLAMAMQAIPIIAEAGKTVEDVVLWRITGERKGRGQSIPCERFPAPSSGPETDGAGRQSPACPSANTVVPGDSDSLLAAG